MSAQNRFKYAARRAVGSSQSLVMISHLFSSHDPTFLGARPGSEGKKNNCEYDDEWCATCNEAVTFFCYGGCYLRRAAEITVTTSFLLAFGTRRFLSSGNKRHIRKMETDKVYDEAASEAPSGGVDEAPRLKLRTTTNTTTTTARATDAMTTYDADFHNRSFAYTLPRDL
ncbi:hypothetical protein MSG28_014828 [Choristoneura fumiferana]|uniref:Uncharacterized protein n=1 Tax=Choristoneura fumiferana TaxID=7141 RepID=A0ACC0JT48_CHOFU|nr:hypothetical protein MSG28_014828 [Choristoneura fumiferana]